MAKYVWVAVLTVLVLFVYATKAILLPFIAGLAVAYFLDPIADKLEERRIPRGLAATSVLSLFFALIVGFILSLWPIMQSQLLALAQSLPGVVAGLRPWLNEQLADIGTLFDGQLLGDVDSMLSSMSEAIFAQVQSAAAGLLRGGVALFNLISLLLITPVVAFYLLRDWDHLTARVDDLLPSAQAGTIRRIAVDIDTVLAGFVRGQILVCLVMAAFYAIGWSLVGLNYGLILGAIAGVLAFIPFIGTLFAAALALMIGFAQWGADPINLGLVGLVYLIVQILEGAVLTPRLVGERVGLHPVWVLFAVFAGGEVMGFVGVLVAVPMAAALAVLVRYGIEEYRLHHQPSILEESETGDESIVSTVSTDDETETVGKLP